MTNVTRVFCASLPCVLPLVPCMLPLALCALLLVACGQSGPLTLPDQSPPPDASQDVEPVPGVIPEAVPDPAQVPDDESIQL